MVTKEDFLKVWKDSSRESILNQFYYEHIELREAIEVIDEAYKKLDKIDAWLEVNQASHLYKAKDLLKKYIKEK